MCQVLVSGKMYKKYKIEVYKNIYLSASHQNVRILVDGGLDLLPNGVFRALEVLTHVAGVVHEGEEVVVDPNQLEVLALHVRHLHVVGGWADVFQLFTFIKWVKTSILNYLPVKMSRATMWTLA